MKKTLLVFILLGLVSLLADVVYEGARSIIGAYLKVLEAAMVIAGVISFGEFIGYVMRGVGGFIANRFRSSRVYWMLIFLGYSVNLFAIPLLAFVGSWEYALVLVFIERMGKGLRAPARDVIISEVTEDLGKGKGFGIHEVMDQLGAITGPAIVAWILLTVASYKYAFLVLAIPALLSITTLFIAYVNYPKIKSVEVVRRTGAKLPAKFLVFLLSISLMSLGFMHWGLVSYSLKHFSIFEDYFIPTLYLIAMLTDAIIAFPIGVMYDKIGVKSTLISPILIIILMALFASGKQSMIVLSIMLWGLVMGIYETIIRASIADLVPMESRAKAYGLYGIIFGASWTLGNIMLSYIMQISATMMLTYVVIVEIIAFLLMAYTCFRS
ncbi:MAG: MFS transporter [Thermoprotei archaeon]|nr:MAG: MFS transporter [Thermoprotei archaeon]